MNKIHCSLKNIRPEGLPTPRRKIVFMLLTVTFMVGASYLTYSLLHNPKSPYIAVLLGVIAGAMPSCVISWDSRVDLANGDADLEQFVRKFLYARRLKAIRQISEYESFGVQLPWFLRWEKESTFLKVHPDGSVTLIAPLIINYRVAKAFDSRREELSFMKTSIKAAV